MARPCPQSSGTRAASCRNAAFEQFGRAIGGQRYPNRRHIVWIQPKLFGRRQVLDLPSIYTASHRGRSTSDSSLLPVPLEGMHT